MNKESPYITLADGVEFPCNFFGYAESIGWQYIDIPNITLAEAASIFSDLEKTSRITFTNFSDTVVREGFTVCVGVTLTEDVCRITMRRPYVQPGDTQALGEAKAEAAEYKAALELLGITTEEVTR